MACRKYRYFLRCEYLRIQQILAQAFDRQSCHGLEQGFQVLPAQLVYMYESDIELMASNSS